MSHADPRPVIDSLRTQVATHDKRIAFLFGAGTSCSVSPKGSSGKPLIPAVAALTAICADAVIKLGTPEAEAWKALTGECETIHKRCDIEVMLSRLRMKLDAMGPSDTLIKLSRDKISEIEKTITSTIARVVSPDLETIPEAYAHHQLGRWISSTPRKFPVEIFTTNYDLLIERALEDQRVPIFDGFVGSYRPFFLPDSLFKTDVGPGQNWVRLWKIHGSVNWKWENILGRRRIIRSEPVLTGEMILPSHYKYDESRKQPYLTLLDRLRRVMEQDDTLLITSGYSFSDEHINSVILEALGSRPRTHAVSLQFEDIKEDTDLDRAARSLKNIIVIGPTAGIVAGRRVAWKVPEEAAAGEDEAVSVTVDSGKAPVVRVSLGNFAGLAKFLSSLSSR
jgi:hypothetical protein